MTQTFQPRICSYYKGSCTHVSENPRSLLDLSEVIRHKIYLYAGSISNASIRLVSRGGEYFFASRYEDLQAYLESEFNLFCTNIGVPIIFLHKDSASAGIYTYIKFRSVSRLVSFDIARCLCSYNEIVVDGLYLPRSLALFKDLRRDLLRWIRRFTLVLKQSHRARGVTLIRKAADPIIHMQNHAACPDQSQGFQTTYAELIRCLASSNIANFALICDVEDEATARLLLKPVESLKLSRCTIRISGMRNSVLEDSARSTVLRATGEDARKQPFLFLNLPTELRQLVLSFTNLVTPYREVQWSPETHFILEDWVRRRGSPCAWGDFCSTQYSVFPKCVCWKPPVPIFLVCKTVLQDARTIFYGCNRFIVSPPYHESMSMSARQDPLEASIFLTQIVPQDSLRHLRDLEILFPCTGYGASGISAQVLSEWSEVLQRVGPHLKKIKLGLYFGVENHPDPLRIRTNDLQSSLWRLCEVHKQILLPLSQLQCIESVFISAWSTFDHEQWPHDKLEEYFRHHEEDLRTLILGTESGCSGSDRTLRLTSRWLSEMYDYVGDEGPTFNG